MGPLICGFFSIKIVENIFWRFATMRKNGLMLDCKNTVHIIQHAKHAFIDYVIDKAFG